MKLVPTAARRTGRGVRRMPTTWAKRRRRNLPIMPRPSDGPYHQKDDVDHPKQRDCRQNGRRPQQLDQAEKAKNTSYQPNQQVPLANQPEANGGDDHQGDRLADETVKKPHGFPLGVVC